jgi:hypothetical protein
MSCANWNFAVQSNLATVYLSRMLSFSIVDSSSSFSGPDSWSILQFHHRKQTLRVSNFPLVAIGTPARATSSHLLKLHPWRAMCATGVVEQHFECEQYSKSIARYSVENTFYHTDRSVGDDHLTRPGNDDTQRPASSLRHAPVVHPATGATPEKGRAHERSYGKAYLAHCSIAHCLSLAVTLLPESFSSAFSSVLESCRPRPEALEALEPVNANTDWEHHMLLCFAQECDVTLELQGSS